MLAISADTIDLIKTRRLCIIQDDAIPDRRACLVAPTTSLSQAEFNSIITLSRGLPFVALSNSRAQAFMLPPMQSTDGRSGVSDALVSVDARENITTGISVADRTLAINILGAHEPDPQKLVKPGHIFPVLTKPGGLLVKHALPEAALDICSISWQEPAALFMDLLNTQGSLLTADEQVQIAKEHKLPLIKISEIVLYRLQSEQLVQKVAETRLPTRNGTQFRALAYRSSLFAGEHMVLVKGQINSQQIVLTRVHAEQTFSDVFGGSKESSRKTLHNAINSLEQSDCGIILYLRKPEAGSLSQQLSSNSNRQDNSGTDGLMREYGIGAQILKDLGARQIELLTNSKPQLIGLDTFGINIVGCREI